MTTTLASDARRNAVLFTGADFSCGEHKPSMHFAKRKTDDGGEQNVLRMTDVPVFRSGTFRDSMGFQHTWESIHMDQMVAHFDMLKSRAILPEIPVRKGHGSFLGDPMDGLIGWHTALRTKENQSPSDGKDYVYLLADYDILDSDAIQKITNGLWRNRSAEVGSYITNSEAEFWPVYMGVAYVDFSAVEGLNVYSKVPHVGTQFSLMLEEEEEAPVAEGTGGAPAAGAPASTDPTTQPAAQTAPAPVVPVAPAIPAGTLTAPAAVPAGSTSSHSLVGQVHTFTMNGETTNDFGAVQRHVDTLETFRKETLESGRKAFVSSLATGNKIAAPQVPQLEVFALGLDDTQWTAWVASWDAAPQSPLLALHGQSGAGTTSQPANQPTADELEIETAKGIVSQHKLSGMRRDLLEKTPSFIKLKSLGIPA